MCYVNIESIETPRQKVFYKVIQEVVGCYMTTYTRQGLEKGVALKARNVLPGKNHHHYMSGFQGWGVFSRFRNVLVYQKVCSFGTHVRKVICSVNPRIATIAPGADGEGLKCYLFDEIIILEDK